jgi:hypothetical protein
MSFAAHDRVSKRQRGAPQHRPPACSLQLHAAGELLFRSRIFAATSHNSSGAHPLRPPSPPSSSVHYTGRTIASLAPADRLRSLGCALIAILVVRMADANIPATRTSPALSQNARRLMRFDGVLRRVCAGRALCTPEGLHDLRKISRVLLDDWCFADAAAKFHLAIACGAATFHAELAWLLLWGRHAVPVDKQAAFRAAQDGARRGCMHSRGVFALCLAWGAGCPKDAARAMQLATTSSAAGSKYGLFALGRLLLEGHSRDDGDAARALSFFRQAAAQNLDAGTQHFRYSFIVFQCILILMSLRTVGRWLPSRARYWCARQRQGSSALVPTCGAAGLTMGLR